MTNIGVINYGSNIDDTRIPGAQEGDTLISYNGFSFEKNCDINADKSVYLSEINVRDDPKSRITKSEFGYTHGIQFLDEKYTEKNIEMKFYIFETSSESYSDIVAKFKDSFATQRGVLKVWYRKELMEAEVVKSDLKFDWYNTNVRSVTINFIAKPFLKSTVLENLGGQKTGSYGIVELNNKGNYAFPTVSVIPESNCGGIYLSNGIGKIRYIRDWLNGSTANAGSHFVELQAIDRYTGENVALGKTVTGLTAQNNSRPYSRFTNGSTNAGTYTEGGGYNALTVDLDGYYDIETIKVWHYYLDKRTYHDTKTEVSEDGQVWYTVFDSKYENEYAETPAGHTIFLDKKINNVEGKRTVIEDVDAGDVINFDWQSGQVTKNGYPAKTRGTLPEVTKNSSLVIGTVQKETLPSLSVKSKSYGSLGNGLVVAIKNEWSEKITHEFDNIDINYLKQIKIYGNSKSDKSVEMTVKVFTDKSKNNLITEFNRKFYAGYAESDPTIDINGAGFDMSSYSKVALEFSFIRLGIGDSEYFSFKHGTRSNGITYDIDGVAKDYSIGIELLGLDAPYEPTYENSNGFDYNIKYYNLYI